MVDEVVKAGIETAETVVETVGETGVEAVETAVQTVGKAGGNKVTYIVIGGITFLVIGGIIVGVVAKKRKNAKNSDENKKKGPRFFGRKDEPNAPETDVVEMEVESVD